MSNPLSHANCPSISFNIFETTFCIFYFITATLFMPSSTRLPPTCFTPSGGRGSCAQSHNTSQLPSSPTMVLVGGT